MPVIINEKSIERPSNLKSNEIPNDGIHEFRKNTTCEPSYTDGKYPEK